MNYNVLFQYICKLNYIDTFKNTEGAQHMLITKCLMYLIYSLDDGIGSYQPCKENDTN